MRVHIITYGCSNNKAESQIMTCLLRKEGNRLVDNIEDADAIVLNTCSVKSTTEQKILHNISSIHEKNPEKHIVIAGCMPEAEYDKVKRMAPYASMLSTHHIDKINEAVKTRKEFMGKARLQKVTLPKASGEYPSIIPISSGCLSACSFCSTKLAKGNLISYHSAQISMEIARAKEGGQKEFWLTSQDCGCYGFDNNTTMSELINKITTCVRGQYFLRIGMMNPQHTRKILKELIDAYKNNHVFKFLHLPVQSGSQKILDDMRRGHKIDDFFKIVEQFRKEMPDITIWTDIIVGFPGETEDDFTESMKLLRNIRPDFTNISSYSVRPNTKAAQLKQIPTHVKKARTRKMSELARSISLERNQRWIGRTCAVIIDEYNKEKGNYIGRNSAYKPVAIKGKHKMGEVIPVKIVDATSTCLIGVE